MERREVIVVDDEAVERRLSEKAEARRRDAARLARGEMTQHELQRENSMFEAGWTRTVEIVDFYENVGRS